MSAVRLLPHKIQLCRVLNKLQPFLENITRKRHVCEQVKTLEGQCTQQGQELSDMQSRLSQEEQREEEMRKETFTLRQRVLECDAGREAALKEVQLA